MIWDSVSTKRRKKPQHRPSFVETMPGTLEETVFYVSMQPAMTPAVQEAAVDILSYIVE